MAVIPGCSEVYKGGIHKWGRAGTCPDPE